MVSPHSLQRRLRHIVLLGSLLALAAFDPSHTALAQKPRESGAIEFGRPSCWDCPVALRTVVVTAVATLIVVAVAGAALASRHPFAPLLVIACVLPAIYLLAVPVYYARWGVALTWLYANDSPVVSPGRWFPLTWLAAGLLTAIAAYRHVRHRQLRAA